MTLRRNVKVVNTKYIESIELQHLGCLTMCLQKSHSVSKSYFDDLKRIENEILSLVLEVNPKIVVDVGVGEFTQNFILNTMNFFIALDIDYGKLIKFSKESNLNKARLYKLEFICANALYFPLRPSSIDLALFHFVLHEIDRSPPTVFLGLRRSVHHGFP
ncbi:MAG: hypothetical protein DRJ38_10130 [Thermoprotei archaeon]|nr:MAG: hypothetical protein DRJ38_10130 [Thermoprotei archaeon]